MIESCFEVGTGRPIALPLAHLAITGQTQEAGKTTALEALALRSGRKAIAFLTKRGEGSFIVQHPIPPYFAEPVNDAENPLWKWVKGILESNQQRKMTFEESWLIKACESPRLAENLADVASNIQELLSGKSHLEMKHEKGSSRGKMKQVRVWDRKPVSGMNESIYTSLNAYFKIVLPQIARLPLSPKGLRLRPGLNVMDLSDFATDTQALVIRSVLEWVYRYEENTIVIIPEAWEFVPRGKNSPVRMAAEIFIRKAAAMRNFMWIDSQDIVGVDYMLFRGTKVWLLGVQRQKDEVQRTLDAIPDLPNKPTKTQILTLQNGQFYACFGTEIRKIYVQPAWMESEVHAQAIARGEESVTSARKILDEFVETQEPQADDETEAHEKTDGIAAGRSDDTGIESGSGSAGQKPSFSGESVEVSRGSGDEESANDTQFPHYGRSPGEDKSDEDGSGAASEDESMWREKYEELKVEHGQLMEAHDALAAWKAELIKKFPILAMPTPDCIPEIAPALEAPARADGERLLPERNAELLEQSGASSRSEFSPAPAERWGIFEKEETRKGFVTIMWPEILDRIRKLDPQTIGLLLRAARAARQSASPDVGSER